MRIITLTTDFGEADGFVGTMKGVILGIHPSAVLVDLTHGIPAGDVRGGAFVLAAAQSYFPKDTIHLAVIDPGVGSCRAAIAVRTTRAYYVGPDNGVLAAALRKETIRSVRKLDDPKWWLPEISQTFHGRDIFAPVAAHLSAGVAFHRLGSLMPSLETQQCPWPEAHQVQGRLQGEIIYIDRFGNAMTNLPNPQPEGPTRTSVLVWISGRRPMRVPLADCYSAVPRSRRVAVPGSSGYIELAINQGNAATKLGLAIGNKVALVSD